MQKSFFQKAFFLTTSVISIFISIYYTNHIDFIHGIVFDKNEMSLFPFKIMSIAPWHYAINLLWSFTVAGLFSLACASLGMTLIWKLIKSEAETEQLTLSAWAAILGSAFLVGHATFSIIFILLSTFYLFTIQILISIILATLIIGFPFIRKIFLLFPSTKNLDIKKAFKSNQYRLILIFVITIILFSILYSTSRLSYDAVAFYFSDEKITSLTNHIQFFQNNNFVASSFQAGISYAALIKISGEQAARIYTWINGLIIILFGLAIGETIGLSKQARLIALVLLLTSTAFLDLIGDGKVEIISTAAAMAAVYWTIENIDKRITAISFLTGILAGVAIASRPYNAFLICAFIGIYFSLNLYINKGKGILSLLKSLLWIGSGVLCLALTHLFINWAILGDALAFLKNLQTVDSPDKWHWTITPDNIWIIRLLYPLSVTFINIAQSDGNISPLFICALCGMLLVMGKNKIEKPLLVLTIATLITLGTWLCLIYTVFEIRYVLFLWVLLFMPTATIIEKFLSLEDLLLKRFMQSALLFLLFFTAARTLFVAVNTYSPVDALGNSHCDNYAFCDSLQPINDQAPLGSRVLALNAFKYYLRSDLLMCLSKHDEYAGLQKLSIKDNDAFWLEVYRQGYQYIAYEKIYSVQHLRFEFEENFNKTPAWLTLKPIYGKVEDDVATYQIDVNNPPIKVEQTCAQNELKIWEVKKVPPDLKTEN